MKVYTIQIFVGFLNQHMMPKPPRELRKQIEIFEETIKNLNEIIDTKKVKVDYYGEDFQEPLSDIRQDALALRSKIEIFKSKCEAAMTLQYTTNERFAVNSSSKRVIDSFLSQ